VARLIWAELQQESPIWTKKAPEGAERRVDMGWYSKGLDDERMEAARNESRKGSASRYFLKAGETKRIIMLDDDVFCIWEHNPKVNGEFWHYFTCRKGADPDDPGCPMCLSKVKRYYVGFITILDVTITRTSTDAPKVGDDWEFIQEVDPFKDEQFFYHSRLEGKKKPPEPFDYLDLFKPISSAEMMTIGIGGSKKTSNTSDGDGQVSGEGGSDEDALY
jgi:hypothetical protein